MRTFSRCIVLFTLLLTTRVSVSAAAEGVKELIFRDCTKTLAAYSGLDKAEREKLLPFLREVLKLKIDAVPLLPGKLGAIPGSEADVSSLWRSFSPGREVAAKRCALRVLSSTPALAIPALPEILEFASEPVLADDMAELADAAVFEIAASLSGVIEQREMNAILPSSVAHLDILGDVVLAHTPIDLAVRGMWEQSSRFSPKNQLDSVEFFPWLDPTGHYTQSSALSDSAPVIDRIFLTKVLATVRCPSALTLRFLRDLFESGTPDEKHAAREGLQRLILTLREERLCPAASGAVSGSDLLNILFEDVEPGDAREINRLDLALPLLAGRNHTRAFTAARGLMEASRELSSWENSVALRTLMENGSPARDLLLELLKSKNPLQRRRAALALEGLKLSDPRKLRPFVAFLTDPDAEVRKRIYLAVAPSVADLRSEVRKVFGSANARMADYAALALAASGSPTPISRSVLFSSIDSLDCRAVLALADILDLSQPKLQQDFIAKTRSCLLKDSQSACETLRQISAYPQLLKSVNATDLAKFDANNPACIIAAFSSPGVKVELGGKAISLFTVFRSKDEAMLQEALRLLPQAAATDTSLIPSLREMALAPETSVMQRRAAIKGLGSIQKDVTFWSDFVHDAIASGRIDDFAVLHCVDSPLVRQTLEAAFDASDVLQRPKVARLMGWLGAQAARFESKLSELANSKNSEARYQATLAALRISEQPQLVLTQVEALLKTRMARKLSSEAIPASAYSALMTLAPEKSPLQARLLQILKIEGAPVRSFEERICG